MNGDSDEIWHPKRSANRKFDNLWFLLFILFFGIFSIWFVPVCSEQVKTMIHGKKVPFRASTSDLDRVQSAKQFALNHGGKWISKTQLQRATKRQFHLYSQSTESVCHKYLFARESA
jgi:hypothetical protein